MALHISTTKTEHKVEGRPLLNVVVREGVTILQLLSSKDEALLIRGDALLILNLGLDIVNSVGRLDIKSDGFAGKGLHKNLHSSKNTEHKLKG